MSSFEAEEVPGGVMATDALATGASEVEEEAVGELLAVIENVGAR